MKVKLSDGKCIHTVDPFLIGDRWAVDYISTFIEENGCVFEHDVVTDCLQTYRERIACGYALDIGANLGSWSIYLADVAKSVVAYEPHPVVADLLRNTVIDNGSNVHVIEAALSSTREDVVLAPSVMKTQRASVVVNEGGSEIGAKDIRMFSVHAHNQDDHYQLLHDRNLSNTKCSCIKIDVEGHEPTVLSQLYRTLEDDHPLLFIECNTVDHIAAVMDRLPRGYSLVKQYSINGNHVSVYDYCTLLPN
jgi:FkbM family methyltransferase